MFFCLLLFSVVQSFLVEHIFYKSTINHSFKIPWFSFSVLNRKLVPYKAKAESGNPENKEVFISFLHLLQTNITQPFIAKHKRNQHKRNKKSVQEKELPKVSLNS